MPKRIPLHTIILVRDGKRVVPEVGKPFDFTSDELKSIKEASPNAVREPINEGGTEPVTEKNETKSQATAGNAGKGNAGKGNQAQAGDKTPEKHDEAL